MPNYRFPINGLRHHDFAERLDELYELAQGKRMSISIEHDNTAEVDAVLDVIGAINEQDDYAKTRNYWKYLKNKLKQEGNEVVSATNQLKLLAPDGKRRLTDVLEAMTQSVADSTHIKQLLQDALTDEINSREMFMKGIDYSYYYESEG